MRDHTKLRAFELADKLALVVYKTTASFPREEMYGLISQMRRAAVSVASNIVEGCARETQAEYFPFLEISFASLRELHYQFSLSTRLGFCSKQDMPACEELLVETEKVLSALLRSMRGRR
jgi:four helix bundle protein